jgi:hypothetical protein
MDYLDSILETEPIQNEELKSVRKFIRGSFDELGCCLLPHPGKLIILENLKF